MHRRVRRLSTYTPSMHVCACLPACLPPSGARAVCACSQMHRSSRIASSEIAEQSCAPMCRRYLLCRRYFFFPPHIFFSPLNSHVRQCVAGISFVHICICISFVYMHICIRISFVYMHICILRHACQCAAGISLVHRCISFVHTQMHVCICTCVYVCAGMCSDM